MTINIDDLTPVIEQVLLEHTPYGHVGATFHTLDVARKIATAVSESEALEDAEMNAYQRGFDSREGMVSKLTNDIESLKKKTQITTLDPSAKNP